MKKKELKDTDTHIVVRKQRNSKNGFKGYTVKMVPRATAEIQLSLPVEKRNHHWKTISKLGEEDPNLSIDEIPGIKELIEKRAAEMAKELVETTPQTEPEKKAPGRPKAEETKPAQA